jgi:hypothetical protein
METLNTPNEIALWIGAAAAYMTNDNCTHSEEAARVADLLVLELRKRLLAPTPVSPTSLNEQLRLAAERGQRVRVRLDNGGVREGLVIWGPSYEHDAVPAQVADLWCGEDAEDSCLRVTSVEILDISVETLDS